jgi:hypothetical protein
MFATFAWTIRFDTEAFTQPFRLIVEASGVLAANLLTSFVTLDKFRAERNIPFSVQHVEHPSAPQLHLPQCRAGTRDGSSRGDGFARLHLTSTQRSSQTWHFHRSVRLRAGPAGANCPAITIVRPFCLMTDEEIQKTATGMRLLEKSFMEPVGCGIAASLTDDLH